MAEAPVLDPSTAQAFSAMAQAVSRDRTVARPPITHKPTTDEPVSERGIWGHTRRLGDALPHTFFQESEPGDQWKAAKEYRGRAVIGRDSAIDGGVYVVRTGNEACVVDSQKDRVLETYYQYFLADLKKQAANQGQTIDQLVLSATYTEVMNKLPWDMRKVSEINNKLGVTNQNPEPKEVSLAVYVSNEAGMGRHQALYAGFLLERLKKDGLIEGHVSVDKNWISGKGGHPWVRYVDTSGEVYILDPSQKFVGKLSEVDPNQHWFYQKPEEN